MLVSQLGKNRTRRTPAEAHSVLSKKDCPKTPEEAKSLSRLPYAELIGCLLFLSNQTRVDIAVAVNDCARFMSNFGLVHWLVCSVLKIPRSASCSASCRGSAS